MPNKTTREYLVQAQEALEAAKEQEHGVIDIDLADAIAKIKRIKEAIDDE